MNAEFLEQSALCELAKDGKIKEAKVTKVKRGRGYTISFNSTGRNKVLYIYRGQRDDEFTPRTFATLDAACSAISKIGVYTFTVDIPSPTEI